MKTLLWLLTFFTLLHASETLNSTDPYKEIHYFTLKNGLQVYLLDDNKTENTQIKLTVNLGYGIEDDKTYGLAHLVEHMVFRDQRVPYHDYLDYIKEEGGTYVNGYTKQYETNYLTTIKNEKAYWIVKTFSKMLFDKNITEEDLKIEQGALQTEVGESHLYDKPMWFIGTFLKKISPPSENTFNDLFQIPKEKELPARYIEQQNNKKFTLNDVMKRYNAYYYPANMKLFVVGNFDIKQMEQTIHENYDKIIKTGQLSVKAPKYTAILPNKQFQRFYPGTRKNEAYLGALFVGDYRTYLILDAYTQNLAQRLQQKMRNEDGKTYSVNNYVSYYQNSGTATITFDSLHDDFNENIKIAKEMMQSDIQNLDEETINKALKSYEEQYFQTIEHDNNSLMGLIETTEWLKEDYNISKQSAYDVFKTISPEVFKATIQKTFTEKNNYSVIHRDYYLFPLEMVLLSFLLLGLFIFLYIRLYKFKLKKINLLYTHREIKFSRRVSSRFTGFIVFLATFFYAEVVSEWIKYFILKFILGDASFLLTLDLPYSYLAIIPDFTLFMVVFFFIYRTIWRYFARIDVLNYGVVMIGNHVKFMPKEKIVSLDIAPWSLQNRKKTIGTSIRFWKPVLKVTMQDDEVYYIRSTNASHLKEDLEKVIFSS